MASARSDLDGMVDECLCTHMAVLDGKLYAVGGFNGDHLSSVERYDSAENAWEAVAAPPMATARRRRREAILSQSWFTALQDSVSATGLAEEI